MIRRSTIVYLLLLLGLVGVYYYLSTREPSAEAEATLEPTVEVAYLFSAEEGTPSSFRLEAKSGAAVELERGGDNAWKLIQPVEAAADPAAAEAAASQLTTLRILDTVPDLDPASVGLEPPEYVLTLKFTSGTEQTIDLGVLTVSESGYYARDPDGKIVIVSRDAIDALLSLLENLPYLETPTPSPVSATESATPLPVTPEADSLPTATATP
jgi:hypothetical protein